MQEFLNSELLPPEALERELDFIKSIVPVDLYDNEEAMATMITAASLLHEHQAFYGSDEQIREYSGDVETDVPATWHRVDHPLATVREGVGFALRTNEECRQKGLPPLYSPQDIMAIVVGMSGHDRAQGHGRGIDEDVTMDMLARKLEMAGAADLSIAKATSIVDTTKFREATRGQNFDPNSPFALTDLAGGGADLETVASPRGPVEAVGVFVENACREKGGMGRILAREIEAHNNRVHPDDRFFGTTTADYMDFITAYGSQQLKGKLIDFLNSNADFQDPHTLSSHTFPAVEVPGYGLIRYTPSHNTRELNAQMLRKVVSRLRHPERPITAGEAYEELVQYRHRLE